MNHVWHLLLLALIVSGATAFSSCKGKRGEMKPIRYTGSYNRDFNDLNDLHLAAARKIGIKPVASRKEAKRMASKLVEIKSNDDYEVEDLTHSIPFLVSDASSLLKDVGRNFRDSLSNLNAPEYRILVTSVTRTVEDVSKLSRRNYNASQNSAHRYGTTFDVSWVRFSKADAGDPDDLKPEQLKMVLASVLRDLKKEGRCYVKHERKQGCFHITVRK